VRRTGRRGFGLEVTLPCGMVPSGPNSVLGVLVVAVSLHALASSTRRRDFRRPK
jgi:hypothetical protein